MRPSTLLPTTILSGLAFAQNNTNGISNNTCTGNWEQRYNAARGSVNATGSSLINWTTVANTDRDSVKPWYLSVLVNNTNENNETGRTITWPFLSVPDDVEANACVYQFGAQNKTSTGNVGSAVGCGGVFSEKCVEYLRASVLNNTNGISGAKPSCRLPQSTDEELKRREEACGDIGSSFSSLPMGDVGNASASCSYDRLSGIDLPEGYISRPIGLSLSPYKDQVYQNAMAYNLSVVHTTTFAVVAAFEAGNMLQKDVSFVCVTPNNTQPGSYLPENKTPWKTSDAGAHWGTAGRLSVWMAGAVSMLLVL